MASFSGDNDRTWVAKVCRYTEDSQHRHRHQRSLLLSALLACIAAGFVRGLRGNKTTPSCPPHKSLLHSIKLICTLSNERGFRTKRDNFLPIYKPRTRGNSIKIIEKRCLLIWISHEVVPYVSQSLWLRHKFTSFAVATCDPQTVHACRIC